MSIALFAREPNGFWEEGIMRDLLLKRKGAFAIYIMASCLFIVSDLLYMSVSAMIFDALEQASMDLFIKRVLLGIGIIMLMGILYLISRFLRIDYMRNILLDIRLEGFKTILKMSPKQFGKISKENYVSRLTNDINLIEEKFFISLLHFISGLGMYLIGIGILFVTDKILAIGVFAVSVICYLICKLFSARTDKLQEAVSEENERFILSTSNTLNGLEIIKLGNIEEKFLAKNKKDISKMEARKLAFNNYSEIQQNVLLFANYLVMVGIVFHLGMRIADGMALGIAVFLFQLSIQIVFRITDTLPLFNVIRSSSKIYNKITKLEEQNEVVGKLPFRFQNQITVQNMNFSYEGEKPIIGNASFRIEKGKKYLIKGASGSGKSSLLKILEMIYDDYEGSIKVDGVDYKEICQTTFNEQVAVIDQDIFLFEDTIENNISLYKPLSEEVMQRTIKGAGLEVFIQEQEGGVKLQILENGKNLSGGQRQRIAIARAIAKKAEILFVDEGTSSLNEALGREIEKVFLELPQTVIAISHRYYEGVSEGYDYVLELQSGHIKVHDACSYFEGVNVC